MADDSKRDGKFWAVALDRAQLGLWDWNLSTGDCYYSPTWSKMLGYEPGELASTPDLWLRLTHPDDRQRAQESGERAPSYDEAAASAYMKNQELTLRVGIGLGSGRATVYTCDLTHGYIDINGSYRS